MSTGQPSNVITLPGDNTPTTAVRRHGMGYRGIWPQDSVVLNLNQCRYERGDLSGLLMVFKDSEFLVAARFNVAAQETRRRLALDLEERTEFTGWRTLLEEFCRQVIRLDTTASPPQWLPAWKGATSEQYLLEPMLPAGKATIIYGEGGVMKSTLATACGLAVATGRSVLGWNPRPQGERVLVLDWESDEDDWSERATLLAAGMGVDYPEEMLAYQHCDRPLRQSAESVAAFVEENKIGLLIVDSVGLAAGVGQDGGDPAETALKLFQALRPIACTSLLLDHVVGDAVGKPEGSKRPYGSVYKVNLARSVWELRAEPVGEAMEAVLRHRKVNRGKRQPNVEFKVRHGTDEISLDRQAVTAPTLRAGATLEVRLSEMLGERGATSVGELARLMPPGDSYAAIDKCLQRHDKVFIRLGRGLWGLRA